MLLSFRKAALACLFLVITAFLVQDVGGLKDDAMMEKVGPMLKALYNQNQNIDEGTGLIKYDDMMDIMHVSDDGMVAIEVTAYDEGDTLDSLIADMIPLGFVPNGKVRNVVSGMIPISSLGDMPELEGMNFARPVMAVNNAGSVLSEGVQAMEVDLEKFGVDGTGIQVGVLSDSYDNLGGAATDVLTGDLPADVIVLDDLAFDGIDEGRAMMQLIHDVAPGSKLAFHTAFTGQPNFAQGIVDLARNGSQVIVDDIIYFAEPMFQDGIIAQAVDEVRAMGVSYFSAAGNSGRQSYESAFRDSGQTLNIIGFDYKLHDFRTDGNSGLFGPRLSQTIRLPANRIVIFVLQWDETFATGFPGSGGSRSDIDIFLSPAGDILSPVWGSFDVNIGQDPFEIFGVITGPEPEEWELVIGQYVDAGVPPDQPLPGLMKIVLFGAGNRQNPNPTVFLDWPTNSGASYGHSQAAGGAGVAAASAVATPSFGQDPPLVEAFSSAGGVPFLFDTEGNRRDEPEFRQQPRFTGPDGTQTTVPGFERFFGTSAAAPHVAAVAALMSEKHPNLQPGEIFDILEQTAVDMSDPVIPGDEVGYDLRTGYGLVNASAAIEEIDARKKYKGRSIGGKKGKGKGKGKGEIWW